MFFVKLGEMHFLLTSPTLHPGRAWDSDEATTRLKLLKGFSRALFLEGWALVGVQPTFHLRDSSEILPSFLLLPQSKRVSGE